MYEDYLESFVFKTAKLIAMKLFGRVRKPKNEDEDEAKSDEEPKNDENDLNDEQTSNALVEKSNSQENSDEDENTEEVEKMLDDLMKKQREEKLKKDKDQAARLEYDSLTEGLDEINFHFPIFFLLIVITILGIPSSITWAKNYHYSRILSPDPFKIPATICLVALGFLWQLNTPRNM
jgi:hypothetical protein